jgi:hypothetical protein
VPRTGIAGPLFTGAALVGEGAALAVAVGEVEGEVETGELHAPSARTASAITTLLVARVACGKSTAASPGY